jgi:predicted metalloenzyme YecM
MYTEAEFRKAAKPYILALDIFAGKHFLPKRAQADHLCYKCGSTDSFDIICSFLEQENELVDESFISDRRIAYIKLTQGIKSFIGDINFIEVADQKPDNSQREGFDHVEAFPLKQSYESMLNEFIGSEEVIEKVGPHHTTHEISLGGGFAFVCTQEPHIDKILRERNQ